LLDTDNAAPEWQARSFGWQSKELIVACPLEGLVRTANLLTTNANKDCSTHRSRPRNWSRSNSFLKKHKKLYFTLLFADARSRIYIKKSSGSIQETVSRYS
jgi:hypothetical protein